MGGKTYIEIIWNNMKLIIYLNPLSPQAMLIRMLNYLITEYKERTIFTERYINIILVDMFILGL